MTPRSIRRAAERKAQKLARKAEKTLQPGIRAGSVSDLDCQPPASVSAAQLAANRANAQLSSGPNSPEGKEHSRLNALKTGLTGRTVLLPSDDVEAYQQHVRRFFADYHPADDKEHELVQRLADTAWRLLRIPVLENALFALGRIQFENMFEDRDPTLRAALIDAQSLIAFQKQFNNLSIQESRLFRQFEKTRKDLHDLQSRRPAVGQVANLQADCQSALSGSPGSAEFELGFEFSSGSEIATGTGIAQTAAPCILRSGIGAGSASDLSCRC
jgi:hypothetical protein